MQNWQLLESISSSWKTKALYHERRQQEQHSLTRAVVVFIAQWKQKKWMLLLLLLLLLLQHKVTALNWAYKRLLSISNYLLTLSSSNSGGSGNHGTGQQFCIRSLKTGLLTGWDWDWVQQTFNKTTIILALGKERSESERERESERKPKQQNTNMYSWISSLPSPSSWVLVMVIMCVH